MGIGVNAATNKCVLCSTTLTGSSKCSSSTVATACSANYILALGVCAKCDANLHASACVGT